MDQGNSTKKKGGHLLFHLKLASQLMAHAVRSDHAVPIDGYGVRTILHNHVSMTCKGELAALSDIAKECKACMAQGRTVQRVKKRKALQELSVNSVQIKDGEKSRRPRPPRTRFGCSWCQIYLCQVGPCWEEHIKLILQN